MDQKSEVQNQTFFGLSSLMSSNSTICTTVSYILLICLASKSHKRVFKASSYRKVVQKQCRKLIIFYLFQHSVLIFKWLFELNRIANVFLLENFKCQKYIKNTWRQSVTEIQTSYNLIYCITLILKKLTNFSKRWNRYSYIYFRDNVHTVNIIPGSDYIVKPSIFCSSFQFPQMAKNYSEVTMPI